MKNLLQNEPFVQFISSPNGVITMAFNSNWYGNTIRSFSQDAEYSTLRPRDILVIDLKETKTDSQEEDVLIEVFWADPNDKEAADKAIQKMNEMFASIGTPAYYEYRVKKDENEEE